MQLETAIHRSRRRVADVSRRLLRSARPALVDVFPIWIMLALVTTLPYAVAAKRTPSGHSFTGVLSAYDDTFSYLAWIKEAADGKLLMCDLFTSEPQKCRFFLPLWALLGIVSRVTGASAIIVFHAARLLAPLLLLFVSRGLAGKVMKSRRRVRYSLWLVAFSSGLGWLVYGASHLRSILAGFGTPAAYPIARGAVDLTLPEAFAFRTAFAQVQSTVGAALVCGAISLVILSPKLFCVKRAALGGALVSLLAVIHPYDVVVALGAASAGLIIWPWLETDPREATKYGFLARGAAPFYAGAIPGIAYLFYLDHSSDFLRQWRQGISTPSPAPVEYLLGFGAIGFLSVIGCVALWRSSTRTGRMLVVWIAIQAGLLYAPVNFQRRLVEGLQLPLSVAACTGMFWIAARLRSRMRHTIVTRRLLLAGFVGFVSLTNAGFIVGQVARQDHPDPRRYIPDELKGALKWLGANARPDCVLFSSYMTGNVAPSLCGLRVYIGHYDQTLHSAEKHEDVEAFYSGRMPPAGAKRLLAASGAGYCIYGPFEREIAPDFNPPECLTSVYRDGAVEVFKVIPE